MTRPKRRKSTTCNRLRLEDGTWQLLEDTSKGFLLFVQSKSKEESAA